ncbi:MAG: hypothetical protein ACHP85_00910 [Burkholderiales bacterium]|jgi:hypothetical protein
MRSAGVQGLRYLLMCAVVVSLAGCQKNPRYEIQKPLNQTSVTCTDPAGVNCTVEVQVAWEGVSVRPNPEVSLDGTAITPTFTSATKSVVANIITGLGSHTLLVSGDLAAKGTIGSYSATSTFTVAPLPPPTGGFSLSANPTDLLIERGKSATTTVTVTRSAPFTGAVTVGLSSPPTGITAPSVTVPAGATTAMLTISAAATALHGKPMVGVLGTATGVSSAGTPLRITVGRETGAFAEATPSPYLSSLPSSKTALAGAFRVDIATGAPTLPQPRKASFFRAAQAVGGEIGFTLGPVSNVGGAGFCANTLPVAITRGVVLSGALPGRASQNVVTFLDLTVNAPVLMEVPTDMNVQQTATGPFILFQPRVYFSRDCTLALVAGANKLGPTRHILVVYDLASGQPIGAELPFETSIFSALVRTNGTKQEVEVKVDTGAASAQTAVRTIP